MQGSVHGNRETKFIFVGRMKTVDRKWNMDGRV